MPRALPISSMSRPGSSAISRPSFAAALLNSQPMGFYASAQIVRDAREHGVVVLAPDVNVSQWDATLEAPTPLTSLPPGVGGRAYRARTHPAAAPSPDPSPTRGRGPALRLGLREVKGLAEADGQAIVAGRLPPLPAVLPPPLRGEGRGGGGPRSQDTIRVTPNPSPKGEGRGTTPRSPTCSSGPAWRWRRSRRWRRRMGSARSAQPAPGPVAGQGAEQGAGPAAVCPCQDRAPAIRAPMRRSRCP
jgi:hypothetical protein